MSTTLTVNGTEHTVDADSSKPLLWVLREDLGLTGTKFSCGKGICRSCLILLDGSPVQGCIYTLSYAEGKQITTIEGLDDELAQTIRAAWLAAGVSQCGYCQPGQIISAYALLADNTDPSDDDISDGMRNLCRCGTYPRIRTAIKDAASSL